MKNLGLRILCLLAAVAIWIQAASTTIIEADVSLPLLITNLPPGQTIAGDTLPRDVQVRVRASKLRVFAHKYLHHELGTVDVDLADHKPDTSFSLDLAVADVHTDQEVVAILSPGRLPIRLDSQVTRRLPVTVVTSGEVAPGRIILQVPTAQPDSVEVSGPKRFFENVKDVKTTPLALGAANGRETRTLALESPNRNLVTSQTHVQVSITVAVLEQRVLANLPVIPLVDAGQAQVAVSPPVCDVMVEGPADSVKALVPADVAVTIPLGGMHRGTHTVRGQVDHPAWVTKISLEPATFLVIIGDENAADPSEGRH